MKYFIPLLLILMLFSCNKTSKEVTTNNKKKSESPVLKPAKSLNKTSNYESFDPFYKKFHEDSIFQINRVKFPIEGYAVDTSEQATKWTKTNWIMHRNTVQKIDTSKFTIETNKQKNTYYEKIYIEGGGFASERFFKRINGRWYLVKFIDEDL